MGSLVQVQARPLNDACRISNPSRSRYCQSARTEVGNISGSIVTDVRTAGWEDFRAMDSSHHLPTARTNAIVYEQPIEADTLIPQRVALIYADHGRRESFYVFGSGKSRPSKRIAGAKRLDPVSHRTAIVVKVHQNAVIFDRGRI